jgi:hypothetical protein
MQILPSREENSPQIDHLKSLESSKSFGKVVTDKNYIREELRRRLEIGYLLLKSEFWNTTEQHTY